MDYQKIFDFRYGCYGGISSFGSRGGDEGGNCLLSQLEMEAKAVELAYKGAVRGDIQIGEKRLQLDVVHPSYTVSDVEKIQTLSPLVLNREEPYILTGDFNTVNGDDACNWNKVHEDLMKFDPGRAAQVVENWKRAELVSWLEGEGLCDAFSPERREITLPTRKERGSVEGGIRMDFFFASQGIRVIDAYVLKNEDTEMVSDHYPIVGVFELE